MREFNFLSFLTGTAKVGSPFVFPCWLDKQPEEVRSLLLDGGWLVEDHTRECVCVDGEVFGVEAMFDGLGRAHYFYMEEGTPTWLDGEPLTYSASFAPLPAYLREKLGLRGMSRELVDGHLWNIGTYGQGARDVYLARNPARNASVMEGLRNATPSSLVLQFGHTSGNIPLDGRQVFDLCGLMDWRDNALSFNPQAIIDNVAALQAETQQKEKDRPGRTAHQDAIENLLKAWFRLKYENAKRSRRGERPLSTDKADLLFTTQEGLANALHISKAAVTRAKQNWEQDYFGDGDVYLTLIRHIDISNSDAVLDLYWQLKPRLAKMGIEYE